MHSSFFAAAASEHVGHLLESVPHFLAILATFGHFFGPFSTFFLEKKMSNTFSLFFTLLATSCNFKPFLATFSIIVWFFMFAVVTHAHGVLHTLSALRGTSEQELGANQKNMGEKPVGKEQLTKFDLVFTNSTIFNFFETFSHSWTSLVTLVNEKWPCQVGRHRAPWQLPNSPLLTDTSRFQSSMQLIFGCCFFSFQTFLWPLSAFVLSALEQTHQIVNAKVHQFITFFNKMESSLMPTVS